MSVSGVGPGAGSSYVADEDVAEYFGNSGTSGANTSAAQATSAATVDTLATGATASDAVVFTSGAPADALPYEAAATDSGMVDPAAYAEELASQLLDPYFVPVDAEEAIAAAQNLQALAATYDPENAAALDPQIELWTRIASDVLAQGQQGASATGNSAAPATAPERPVTEYFGVGDHGVVGTFTIGGRAISVDEHLANQALIFIEKTVVETRTVEMGESSYSYSEEVQRTLLVSAESVAEELGVSQAEATAFSAAHAAYLLPDGSVGTSAQFVSSSGRDPTASDRAFLVHAEETFSGDFYSYHAPAQYGSAADHIAAVGTDTGVYSFLPAGIVGQAQQSPYGHALLTSSDQITTVQAHLEDQAVVFVRKMVDETRTNENGESSYTYTERVERDVAMPMQAAVAELGLSDDDAAAFLATHAAYMLSDGTLGDAAAFERDQGRSATAADRTYTLQPPTQTWSESGDSSTPARYGSESQYLSAIGLEPGVQRDLKIAFNNSYSGGGDAYLDASHGAFDMAVSNGFVHRAYAAAADDALAGKWVQIGDRGPLGDDLEKMLGGIYEQYGADTPEKQDAVKNALFKYDERFGVLGNAELIAQAVEINNNRKQGFFERGFGRVLLTVAVSFIPGAGPAIAAGMNAAFALSDGASFGEALLAGAATYVGGQVGSYVGGAVTNSLVSAGVDATVAAAAGGAAGGVARSATSQLIQTGEIDGDALWAAAVAGGVSAGTSQWLTENGVGFEFDAAIGARPGTAAQVLGGQAGSVASGNGLSLEGAIQTLASGYAPGQVGAPALGGTTTGLTTLGASDEAHAAISGQASELYTEYLGRDLPLYCHEYSTRLAEGLAATNPELDPQVVEYLPNEEGGMNHYAVSVQVEGERLVVDLTADQFSLLAGGERIGPLVMTPEQHERFMANHGYVPTAVQLGGSDSVEGATAGDDVELSGLPGVGEGAVSAVADLDADRAGVAPLPTLSETERADAALVAELRAAGYTKDEYGLETWRNPATGQIVYQQAADGSTLAVANGRSVLMDGDGQVVSVTGGKFNDAFAQAKASGAATFDWNGKPYTTLTAEDVLTNQGQGLGPYREWATRERAEAVAEGRPSNVSLDNFNRFINVQQTNSQWQALADAGVDATFWREKGFTPEQVVASYSLTGNDYRLAQLAQTSANAGGAVAGSSGTVGQDLSAFASDGLSAEFGGSGIGSSFAGPGVVASLTQAGNAVATFGKNVATLVQNWDQVPTNVKEDLAAAGVQVVAGLLYLPGLADGVRTLVTGKADLLGRHDADGLDYAAAVLATIPGAKLAGVLNRANDVVATAARAIGSVDNVVAASTHAAVPVADVPATITHLASNVTLPNSTTTAHVSTVTPAAPVDVAALRADPNVAESIELAAERFGISEVDFVAQLEHGASPAQVLQSTLVAQGVGPDVAAVLGRADDATLNSILWETGLTEQLARISDEVDPLLRQAKLEAVLRHVDNGGFGTLGDQLSGLDNVFRYPEATSTGVNLNKGTGGLNDIFVASVDGQHAVVKVPQGNASTVDMTDYEAAVNLQAFGGPEVLGTVRIQVDGVWKVGFAMEQVQGIDLLSAQRALQAGQSLPFDITGQHLDSLNAFFAQTRAAGVRLGDVQPGDFMLTADGRIVPLDMTLSAGENTLGDEQRILELMRAVLNGGNPPVGP